MADPSYRAAQPGEFFCTAGGKWYMCETGTKFVGCCMADPCTNGCHGDILRPAGRSVILDSQSPGGSCGGQTPFWTCGQAPTFWGCCNEDPCMNNSTCPPGKLEPTYWDRPDQYEYFKDLNILLSSTAPRPTSSPLLPTNSSSSGGSSGTSKAVLGGAIGGSLGLCAILGVVFCILWHRRKRGRNQSSRDVSSTMEENKTEPGELASPVSAGTSPPTYSWDMAGNAAHQHQWAHSEVSGEDSKHSPRSPYSELHSKSSLAPVAELPAGPAANEMDALGIFHKSSDAAFGDDVAKRSPVLGDEGQVERRKSTERP